MLQDTIKQGVVPSHAASAGGWYGVLPWLPALLAWVATVGLVLYMIFQFKREKTHQQAIDRFASPAAGALFALLALMAGAISQFYPGKITEAIPLTYAAQSPLSAALGFWINVFLMAALGTAYYAATGRQRLQEVATLQNDSRELRRHTTELVSTLRTLPPEGFMRDYPRLCADMLATYTRALEDPSPDQIREAIRSALRSAALMAHRFSRRGSPDKYRANVMRMRDAQALGSVSSWSEEERILYPRGFEPPVIRGALVFDPALATRATSERAQALGGAPLRIPIPDPARDAREEGAAEGRLRVVPGSAVAFLLGRPFIANDTLDMRSHQELYDLPEAVVTASDSYFRTGPGRDVRSFVSLPLFAEPGRMEGATTGVLNVEFEDTDIFNNDQGTVEQFALAIAPVHFVIVWLLLRLDETTPGDLPVAATCGIVESP